jgi:hypothetical protein
MQNRKSGSQAKAICPGKSRVITYATLRTTCLRNLPVAPVTNRHRPPVGPFLNTGGVRFRQRENCPKSVNACLRPIPRAGTGRDDDTATVAIFATIGPAKPLKPGV